VPGDHHLTRGRQDQIDQDLDERGLAGPVRAEEAKDLSRMEIDVDAAQGGNASRPAAWVAQEVQESARGWVDLVQVSNPDRRRRIRHRVSERRATGCDA
jgi:hypothetical protein